MTPKSLLRHPRAASPIAHLSEGGFCKVVDDDAVAPDAVRRIVLCSGKIYYDLLAAREGDDAGQVALVRVELLYPFPSIELSAAFERYGSHVELVWAQEEPQNMGAWSFIAPRVRELAQRDVTYVGRPMRASPAEGFADAHDKEQQRIIADALRPAVA
jgi:2-oxoglutarate dehydrogenase E1 component